MSQSNTRVGDFTVLAGEALTGLEGYLVKLTHDNGVPEVKVPTAVTDYARYVLIDGAADGARVTVRPLEPGRTVRLKLKGACNPGDVISLTDCGTAADRGKVRALPGGGGLQKVVGIAEEAGVEGQLVLVRPGGTESITQGVI